VVEQSHGTWVALLALGNMYGVAKRAVLVPVKIVPRMSDLAEGFKRAANDIADHPGREMRSVVLCAVQDPEPSDPSTSRIQNIGVEVFMQAAGKLFDLGVPIVAAAGNERNIETEKRMDIDAWPPNLEHKDFPLINVGAVRADGVRWDRSQGGDHLTTYGPGATGVRGLNKDGSIAYNSGTSMGTFVFCVCYSAYRKERFAQAGGDNTLRSTNIQLLNARSLAWYTS
jgi:hypothetical protein